MRATRCTGWVAGAVVALGWLAAPSPSSAAPAFEDQLTSLGGAPFVAALPGGCVLTGENDPSVTSPVVENAGPTTTAMSAEQVSTADGVEVAKISARASGAASVWSSDGSPSGFDVFLSGRFDVVTSTSRPDCVYAAGVEQSFQTVVTVKAPMLLRLSGTTDPDVSAQVGVADTERGPLFDQRWQGTDSGTGTTLYLSPGSYSIRVAASLGASSSTALSASGTVTVHADFRASGVQTVPTNGRGAAYVQLGDRVCAGHAVAASIVADARLADRIRKIGFVVNGHRVQRLRQPAVGAVVSLPVADREAADVVARVTLERRKHQKQPKVLAVRAGFEACAPPSGRQS